MRVLLTGGLGYIGSHIACSLINKEVDVFIVDNLSNCSIDNYTGITKSVSLANSVFLRDFTQMDIGDESLLAEYLIKNKIDLVIHLAGLKSVGDSVKDPIKYLDYNIGALMSVVSAMKTANINNLIFSSTAAVYGEGGKDLSESTSIKCLNPYSESKYIQERIIMQLNQFQGLNYVILRYFNPIGNDPSGLIGENLDNNPTNIMPIIINSIKTKEPVKVFSLDEEGKSYDTSDGSGIRDYIDVRDLADAHVMVALNPLKGKIFNVGYGHGTSVIELITTVSRISKIDIPYTVVERRSGDVAICTADPSNFMKYYNWIPSYGIDPAIRNQLKYAKKMGVI